MKRGTPCLAQWDLVGLGEESDGALRKARWPEVEAELTRNKSPHSPVHGPCGWRMFPEKTKQPLNRSLLGPANPSLLLSPLPDLEVLDGPVS